MELVVESGDEDFHTDSMEERWILRQPLRQREMTSLKLDSS